MARCPHRAMGVSESALFTFLAEPQHPLGTGALAFDSCAYVAAMPSRLAPAAWHDQWQDASAHDSHDSATTAAKQLGPLSFGSWCQIGGSLCGVPVVMLSPTGLNALALHLPERGSKENTPSLTRWVFLRLVLGRFLKSSYIRPYIVKMRHKVKSPALFIR